VRDVLASLPANARKKFTGMTLVEAARHAEKHHLEPMKPVTANGHLNKLSTLLRWAEREEYIDRNPAIGLSVAAPAINRREARKSFTSGQLNAIFQAPIYTGCINDERSYSKAGTNHPRRGRFWLPIISLFHGLRLNEAAQLQIEDIREQHGVDVILVRPGEGKMLKSAAASRLVPVHPEATRIGFLRHVSEMKQAGEIWLFPELPTDRRGYRSDAFQKWFSRFLDSIHAKEPKAGSFHCFRHTWRDALREANTPEERVNALGGWAGNGGMSSLYGTGLRADTLLQEISKVEYPGLDLSHLYF
jgi:integrase